MSRAKGMAGALGLALIFAAGLAVASEEKAVERHYVTAAPAPSFQTWDDAKGKSEGCVSCHTESDAKTMHVSAGVVLGCVDCHGGDPKVMNPGGEVHPR